VPQIDNSNTDYIYAYYNCSGSSNLDDAASVWSSYAMVQHLEETSGTLTDSTSNHNNGTPYGGVTQNYPGQIDGADSYDGTDDYSMVNSSASLNFGTSSFSFLFWFRSRANTTEDILDKKGGAAGDINAGYKVVVSSNAAQGFSFALGNGTKNDRLDTGSHSSRGTDVWTMFAVVVNRTGQRMFAYLNGVGANNTAITITGSVDSALNLTLGRQAGGTSRYFNGALDEIRVLSGAYSADWVKAQYLGMSDQYITFGSEEASDVYTLTVSTVGQGTVVLNNTGPYNQGDAVQLTAVPTTGWSFDHWSGDLSGSANPATLILDTNKTATATFTQDQYTLTVTASGSGSVGKSPNQANYTWGTNVTLTATPGLGWAFAGWSGDVSGTTNPITMNMTSDKAVSATFAQNAYTLTVATAGSGSVTLNNTGPYNYGDIVQLTATATIGWSFDHWSGDLIGSTNPATLTMTGNFSATATFTQNTYTLTTLVDGSGSVGRNNTGPYHYGDAVQLTASADLGWSFQSWSGNLVGSTNPATLTITGNMAVTAHFSQTGTRVYINPHFTEKSAGDIGTNFNVNVTIQNVQDMWGFDFNVTWDSALITLVGVDFNTSLDKVWGSGKWYYAKNESGTGYYKLVALSTSSSFNGTGATTLVTLTFRVEDPHTNLVRETAIHFDTHKLSDSKWTPITHTAEDGLYRITGGKPTLVMSPSGRTCRKFNETFTVQINVTNAGNAKDFRFEIYYNATLLDVVGITWNAWGSGTYTADEVNGILTGYTFGSPISGNVTLLTITFNATYHHLWKDEITVAGWKNIQAGTIYFQRANLSYASSPDLGYVRGGLNDINVGSDFTYKFSPIQGDMDNNGDVDIFDLRTIAAFYDLVNPEYNLTGDSTIDIFDIVVVAANFNYHYSP
jgi:hypothetical protein